MKKKYSTLLNFALATCLAGGLVACSEDDGTRPVASNQNRPQLAMLQGFVKDTNGNPLEGATACTQGECATSDAAGMYTFENLLVTETKDVDEGSGSECLTVHVEPPDANHLNGWVDYCPMAQIDGLESAGDDLEGDDVSSLTLVNPLITFIDGYIAEASTAILPALDSTVEGRIEYCDTGESVAGVTLMLDMESVDPDCESYNCSYSTASYSTTTDADGMFSIADVPDDSRLRLYAPKYTDNNGYSDLETVYTDNEGLVFIGDVCVDPISVGDTLDPCVVSVGNLITSDNFTPTDEGHGVLNDETDGTQGIDIVFTESMNWAEVDENSIVIYDETADAYITDFTTTFSGSTMTITTADPIGDDHYINIFLLKGDFEDLAGNQVTLDRFSWADACGDPAFVDRFRSNNGTRYVQIDLKIFSPDNTNVAAATDLDQVCLAEGGSAGLAVLNAEYPTVFTDQGSSGATGLFQNLNADGQYEDRLEALADTLGHENADVENGYATVTFTEPSEGNWEATVSSGSVSPSGTQSANGTSDSVAVSGTSVGSTVYITSYDDFDNPSDVASIVLGDCVAPTTTLNYAYNTCGHLGYDGGSLVGNSGHTGSGDAGEGYDTDYAAHICTAFASEGFLRFGDGGENAGAGLEGVIGLPTLNLTCRLLKDSSAAPDPDLADTTIFGLYGGANARITVPDGAGDYDATQWRAFRLPGFSDTIGVAFSEDIAMVDGTSPACDDTFDVTGVCDASITSWTIRNNITNTDDGDAPDGGEGGAADLAQITVDDVIDMANLDHGSIIDFTAAVTDTAGNPADNARVAVNDLLPPFVDLAFFAEEGLVIHFNEPVVVNTDDANVDCTDGNDGVGVDTSSVSLWDFTNSTYATVYMNCATVSPDSMIVTIPAENFQGIDRGDVFPQEPDPNANVYDEDIAVYNAIAIGPYAHGSLNWDSIEDNEGNSWSDWNGGMWDIHGNQQCNTPLFAVVDLLGEFDTIRQSVSPFANGAPICDSGVNDLSPYDTAFLIEFNQPLDIEFLWGGDGCTDVDATVDCANTAMDSTWVGSYIEFSQDDGGSYDAIGGVSGDVANFTPVNGTLSSDAKTLTFDFENDCLTFDTTDFFRFNRNTQSIFGGNTLGPISVGSGD